MLRFFSIALVRGRRRVAWRCAIAVAIALAAGRGIAAAAALDRDAAALGSAAGGLAPAGAIADFDADGIADIAVVDRVAVNGDTDYELHLRMSNAGDQTVTFAAPLRTLALTAIDIDRDHDIDLVFTPVVGRRIVAVWLNDGGGHFSRYTPGHGGPGAGDLPTRLPPLVGLTTPERLVAAPLTATSPRRSPALAGARASVVPRFTPRQTLPERDRRAQATLRSDHASPRGPPPCSRLTLV